MNVNRGPRVNQPRPRQDNRTGGPGRNSINDDNNTYGEQFSTILHNQLSYYFLFVKTNVGGLKVIHLVIPINYFWEIYHTAQRRMIYVKYSWNLDRLLNYEFIANRLTTKDKQVQELHQTMVLSPMKINKPCKVVSKQK